MLGQVEIVHAGAFQAAILPEKAEGLDQIGGDAEAGGEA